MTPGTWCSALGQHQDHHDWGDSLHKRLVTNLVFLYILHLSAWQNSLMFRVFSLSVLQHDSNNKKYLSSLFLQAVLFCGSPPEPCSILTPFIFVLSAVDPQENTYCDSTNMDWLLHSQKSKRRPDAPWLLHPPFTAKQRWSSNSHLRWCSPPTLLLRKTERPPRNGTSSRVKD